MRRDQQTSSELLDPAGVVRDPNVSGLPPGYTYGVTRYADVILEAAFPRLFLDLHEVLTEYRIDVDELLTGGGSRSTIVQRFDGLLKQRGWGKRNITVKKLIDDRLIHAARGHEIDMFSEGTGPDGYPGLALEMEWNNKDPFFDRDLLNFAALHREGALAAGIIVTRGPELQKYIGSVVKTSATQNSLKYGQSTTHWHKLIPRINLGGGGECPLLLIGIEPARIDGFSKIVDAHDYNERIW